MSDNRELVATATGDLTLSNLLVNAWDDGRNNAETVKQCTERQLEAVCRYVDRLHTLIRWFDLAYGDNVPVWLTHNLYGQELPENVELAETYRGVIGEKGGEVTE